MISVSVAVLRTACQHTSCNLLMHKENMRHPSGGECAAAFRLPPCRQALTLPALAAPLCRVCGRRTPAGAPRCTGTAAVGGWSGMTACAFVAPTLAHLDDPALLPVWPAQQASPPAHVHHPHCAPIISIFSHLACSSGITACTCGRSLPAATSSATCCMSGPAATNRVW